MQPRRLVSPRAEVVLAGAKVYFMSKLWPDSLPKEALGEHVSSKLSITYKCGESFIFSASTNLVEKNTCTQQSRQSTNDLLLRKVAANRYSTVQTFTLFKLAKLFLYLRVSCKLCTVFFPDLSYTRDRDGDALARVNATARHGQRHRVQAQPERMAPNSDNIYSIYLLIALRKICMYHWSFCLMKSGPLWTETRHISPFPSCLISSQVSRSLPCF